MNLYKRLKKGMVAALFVGALLVFGCFGETTNSKAETGTGTIKGTNVNVRSDAGTQAARVCSLSNGAALIVTGTKKDAAGNIWYAVSFMQNGQSYTGYIMSTYVNCTPTTSQPSTNQSETAGSTSQETTSQAGTSNAKWEAEVIATNVNVRKKAVTGNVVGQVTTGAVVTVRKETTGSDGKTWYYISFQLNGATKKGWIRSDFVKKTESQSNANSENTPQTDSTEIDVSAEAGGNSSASGNNANQSTTAKRTGVITGDFVRVRKKVVDGEVITQLNKNAQVTIKSEKKGTDGYVWFKISFKYNGKTKTGFVRSDFVKVTQETVVNEGDDGETGDGNGTDISTDVDFEAYLTAQGFTESYKEPLRSLHNLHPEWEFRAVQTGLSWDSVIAAESKVGTNLVAKNSITSWKSTEKTAYNWNTNSWYTFDGGAWVAASKQLVAYYMDPRNFLTDSAIFQFESLEYETYHSKAGVRRLLKNTFMSGKFTEPDGSKKGYAASFVKIGKSTGVSPYHLAARCYQEQGKGTSGSVTGTVEGYKNIFNYYNIGAYASGGNSPVIQGLKYASVSSVNEATNYSRPWNTRYKSLLGGAQFIAQKYIDAGQNTLYFQKFNVVPSNVSMLYKHQYMTNIQAAESEAIKMSKAYTAEDKKLVFYIPVYNQMPEAACAKPISNTNPNNYLASLEIEGQQLLPVFNPGTETYDLTVPKKVKKVKISATAIAATSKIAGTGKVKLKRGKNEVKITCTAENGAVKTYTIYIVRE